MTTTVSRVAGTGLVLSVVTTALFVLCYAAVRGSMPLNSVVIVMAPVAWLFAGVTALYAGMAVFGRRTPVRGAGAVPVLAALAAVCLSGRVLLSVLDTGIRDATLCLRSGGCDTGIDWSWAWVTAGLTFFFVAAALYWNASARLGVPTDVRRRRLALLLIALVPVGNIVAFLFFLDAEHSLRSAEAQRDGAKSAAPEREVIEA